MASTCSPAGVLGGARLTSLPSRGLLLTAPHPSLVDDVIALGALTNCYRNTQEWK